MLKLTYFHQTLKFGWNAIFTTDSNQSSFDVSQTAVEAIIDRRRSDSRRDSASKDKCDAGSVLIEGQQSTAISFDIKQPLVSTRLLNGLVLDVATSEDHVETIAKSWNESRYMSRVANTAPIFASCVFL